MYMQCFGALDEKKISELESKLEVTLPESYRNFLKETGGGIAKQDGRNKVLIPSIKKMIAVDVFFGYGVSKNADILYWNNMYKDEICENAVLIGFDVRQGFLFLIAEDDNTDVCYWDDGCTFEESDDGQNVYFLGRDFSMFDIRKDCEE